MLQFVFTFWEQIDKHLRILRVHLAKYWTILLRELGVFLRITLFPLKYTCYEQHAETCDDSTSIRRPVENIEAVLLLYRNTWMIADKRCPYFLIKIPRNSSAQRTFELNSLK